ncbi:hypothetical protein [Deinococcus irradiatisoli]|nr:hypothetical protein [Deinococcus irradiatisoli]
MKQKVISPACFSRALGHLVGIGTLAADEAVNYRYGKVPRDFELLLPHGSRLRHSAQGYVIQGDNEFHKDLDWALR